ncbi:MAG: hypothetical protein DRJ13_14690 [Bacteroidetes bacterium]|nr:MAG: hypothetical protein DRJ13_14690 [Bacteroidota bacterium]
MDQLSQMVFDSYVYSLPQENLIPTAQAPVVIWGQSFLAFLFNDANFSKCEVDTIILPFLLRQNQCYHIG